MTPREDVTSSDPYGCANHGVAATLLRCEQLVVGYRGQALLPPIDFELHHGELCAVIGRNGAGKTTWFRTLLGLLPPISGSLQNVVDPLPMGYVAQRIELAPMLPLRAWDVVAMGLERNRSFVRPGRWSERRRRIHEAFEQVGASNFAKSPFGELSEGQKQRVLFARLLASRPHVAVLDEPTAAMDSQAEKETLALISELCSEHKLAVLIVSHQIAGLLPIANKVLFLDRISQAVVCGTPQHVTSHPSFLQHFGTLHMPSDQTPVDRGLHVSH